MKISFPLHLYVICKAKNRHNNIRKQSERGNPNRKLFKLPIELQMVQANSRQQV